MKLSVLPNAYTFDYLATVYAVRDEAGEHIGNIELRGHSGAWHWRVSGRPERYASNAAAAEALRKQRPSSLSRDSK